MRCVRHVLIFAVLAPAPAALAQHRVAPVYPQKAEPEFLRRIPRSGYDPFVWNYHTGRFDYVPIPYDPEPPGVNYNPFRFNWHSGRWDYVARPLQSDYDALPRESEASKFLDTRIDPQQLTARKAPAPQPAPPIAVKMPPPPINPHLPRPTTAPATKPAAPHSKRDDELARLRSVGQWKFDYAKGRWTFVLPGDE